MGFLDLFREQSSNEDRLRRDLEIANHQTEYYQEAYADSARAILASEDVGWNKLGGSPNDLSQITLMEAKTVSDRLHGYAESNPLLVRGREVRASYLFSGRYEIGTKDAASKISPQQYNIIERTKNQTAVFSMEALERIEFERYAAGNVYVLYDRTAKTFQHLPFREISDIIYNPDDSSEPWYVMREWTATVIDPQGNKQAVTKKMYHPTSDFDAGAGGYATTIAGVTVDDTKRMIVDRVNVAAGGNLGVPDSFAAAPWALAYSAYLSDGSKVLAALAEWAWLVKPRKRPAAERAATTVRSERGAGGTLFTDADVSAMPTSNAIDLNTGRPMAAQVASALGISIVLLLADPGQSGAYGTAQTLSDPNRRTMEARRERNTAFLVHCLQLIGVKDPEVRWPKMSPGSDDEESDIIMKAWGSGLFHEDEVREPLAELANITLLHDTPPEGFMYPNNESSLARTDIDTDTAGSSPEGEVSQDGTTSMTNGQGRDNQKLGNLSHKNQGASASNT